MPQSREERAKALDEMEIAVAGLRAFIEELKTKPEPKAGRPVELIRLMEEDCDYWEWWIKTERKDLPSN